MSRKKLLSLFITSLVFYLPPTFSDEKADKACNSICTDVIKAFGYDNPQKPEVLSCKQEGDIDGDALTLIEGTMNCQIGFLTDIGKGEMDMQRLTTFTVAIKQESDKGNDNIVNYECEKSKTNFTVSFNKDGKAIFKMGDREAMLSQVVSGSGFRYSDGALTLSGKGDNASVEENGKILFGDCKVK